MKVTFILPAIGKKPGQPYIGTWKKMEPLTIAVLKALTPDEVQTEFFDDRLEMIDYETETDLVAIPVEMYTARRAYDIAARFRRRGISVVIGGYHATLCPNEVLRHADAVVTGNADMVWGNVLSDAAAGKLQPIYQGVPGYGYTIPDRTIYGGKRYSAISLIETGRGCNHDCEFCAITASYEANYYRRPIKYIIDEIKSSKNSYVFFVDDNFVANPEQAIELCKAVASLKIKWTAQATLAIARNDELLYWMRKSGCEVILIGYESLDDANLTQMGKEWSLSLGEREHLTQLIHKAGISIYATFVFGFDHDNAEAFEKVLGFSRRHEFFFVAFNHLLPFPGTKLYERLSRENRLLDEYWLTPGYLYGGIPYAPHQFTAEELSSRCAEARRDFFKVSSIFWRSLALLVRNRNLMLYIIFWSLNIELQHEVDEKLGMPIGSGLDEQPK